MSNSPMVSYIKISPNQSSRNGNPIKKITVHHMAGCLAIETCGDIFQSVSKQASANYGIGSDGRVALYVDEAARSWASASYANDCQAVTIEVANSSAGGEWPISDAAWNSLIDLCTDICRRNGIGSLNWTGDAGGSLTCHYMFMATACPGPYLKARMEQLASEVNSKLGSNAPIAKPTPSGRPSAPSGESGEGFGGIYQCNADELNVRDAPSLSGAVVASYYEGQSVVLDDVYYIADGYVWGTYIAYSGNRRYIAVGRATGKPEADDYLVRANE